MVGIEKGVYGKQEHPPGTGLRQRRRTKTIAEQEARSREDKAEKAGTSQLSNSCSGQRAPTTLPREIRAEDNVRTHAWGQHRTR